MTRKTQKNNPIASCMVAMAFSLCAAQAAFGQNELRDEGGSPALGATEPFVREMPIQDRPPAARELAFTAREHPQAFLTAFERGFGEPLEGDAATWEQINYQPWGVEDVTVRMNVIPQAGDSVEVRLRIDLPEGLEDHDAALEDIRIWSQRLVGATLGGEE